MVSRICPACARAIPENQRYKVCSGCSRNYHLEHQCPEHPSASMLIIDPTKPPPPLPPPKRQPAPSGPSPDCFIAAAVYGREDAPELQLLRRFRDEFLVKRFVGRLFVSLYYRLSPCVVAGIKKSELTKRLIEYMFLKPTVRFLQSTINKKE